MIGLNVGSGQRPFGDGWINVDKIKHEGMPDPDVLCDGSDMPVEWADHFDYVCLHHVLEHFGCGEGEGLIREAHRVLKPGGRLLVFVPDMKALAQKWVLGDIDDYIFMVNAYGAYMGHEEDRHRWGFTEGSLSMLVQNAAKWTNHHGWRNRNIPGAEIAWDWWILGMEAIK